MYYAHELYHHGIKGQKWGVRRFQNEDGSVTAAGAKRYYDSIGRDRTVIGGGKVGNTQRYSSFNKNQLDKTREKRRIKDDKRFMDLSIYEDDQGDLYGSTSEGKRASKKVLSAEDDYYNGKISFEQYHKERVKYATGMGKFIANNMIKNAGEKEFKDFLHDAYNYESFDQDSVKELINKYSKKYAELNSYFM